MSKNIGRAASPIGSVAPSCAAIATAYNEAGDGYLSYADGDTERLFAFDGQYGYGDRCIWDALETMLRARRASGVISVRVLDLGCGPGTWLRRIVTFARSIGFVSISARGIDIADEQVKRARELSANLAALPGVALTFETGNILEPLLEKDATVDLCLCLCGVLNHVTASELPKLFAEVARATAGDFIASVRAVGSEPTVYVGGIEQARSFHQDNEADRLDVELQNGRRISVSSHLFSSAELRSLAAPHLDLADLRGIDLFHGRFASDPRWNPEIQVGRHFAGELDLLEEGYCRDPEFVDHATHLMIVGRRHGSRKCA